MDQINRDEYIEVGYIQKHHGLKGEVILAFDPEVDNYFEMLEFLFVEIDGGLVPFQVEGDSLRFRSDKTAICRLGFTDSLTKAIELVGCKVYVPDFEIEETDEQETSSELIGMKAFDKKFGELGLISRVDDFSGNLVITVEHARTQILISLSDEVITSIDEEKREIHLNCPEGLIEIYLE